MTRTAPPPESVEPHPRDKLGTVPESGLGLGKYDALFPAVFLTASLLAIVGVWPLTAGQPWEYIGVALMVPMGLLVVGLLAAAVVMLWIAGIEEIRSSQ